MQAAFDLSIPEIEEFVQHGIARGDIEVLPDKRLEQIGVVRQMVEDLSGRHAIILQLPNKAHDFPASFQSTQPGPVVTGFDPLTSDAGQMTG
jgi:hypothetical protein